MKFPEIFNFGDYLSRADPKTQAQVELLLMLVPFFFGWSVFLYYWVFLLWDFWQAIPLPSTIASVGYGLYFRWRDTVRTEASSMDAQGFTLDWSESIVEDTTNVLSGWTSLTEEQALGMKPSFLNTPEFCPNCGWVVPSVKNTEGKKILPKYCGRCQSTLPTKEDFLLDIIRGRFYTRLFFGNQFMDPEGILFNQIVAMHDAPKDKVFRKIGGQWFTHKGQMFKTSTSKVRMVYVGESTELDHIKFFRVVADPERTRLMQMGIGLRPAQADLEEVNRAMKFYDVGEGMKWALKYRDADEHGKLLEDSSENSKERGYRGAYKLVEHMDRIREQRKKTKITKWINWKNILTVGGLILMAYLVLTWTGFFGPSVTPPPSPPVPGPG